MENSNLKADTVIYGKIFTSDKDNLYAEALAIKNGKFIYVGNKTSVNDYIGPETEIITNEKGLITYGYTEGHTHYPLGCHVKLYNNYIKANDEKIYLEEIAKYIKSHPDDICYYFKGWIETLYTKGGPYAKKLDEINSTKPIIFYDCYGHSIWVNSKAMELSKIDKNTPNPKGGIIHRYEDLTPTGRFDDTAKALIIENIPRLQIPPIERYRNSILLSQEGLLKLGITTMFDAWINPVENFNFYEGYQSLDQEEKLIVNYRAAYEIKENLDMDKEIEILKNYRDNCKKNGKFQINCVKIFMDGIAESKTALMKEPYLDDKNNYGLQRYKSENLPQLINKANSNNFDVHIHSIGDKACEETIKSFQLCKIEKIDENIRNCICHLQFVPYNLIDEFKKFNLIAVPGPFWCCRLYDFHEGYEKTLGLERSEKMYPIKSFIQKGIHLSFGGDNSGGEHDLNPMEGIQIIVTRRTSDGKTEPLWIEEAISVEQALMCYTNEGAYQLHMEKDHGMIKVGYCADIVLLDRDITQCQVLDIKNAKVLRTIVDGKSVYCS